MMTTGPTGFQAQFQEFIFYIGSISQVLYWIIIPIIAIWAVLIFKRAVDCHTGKCCSKHAAVHAAAHGAAQSDAADDGWTYEAEDVEDDTEKPAAKRPIKTDKFVD